MVVMWLRFGNFRTAPRTLTYANKRRLDWTEIGRWAGWRKGSPALRPDTAVCAAFGVSAATVRRRLFWGGKCRQQNEWRRLTSRTEGSRS